MTHPYIVRYPEIKNGEPVVEGTGVTVRTIVQSYQLGQTPEEIVEGYPHLNLAQIFSALSFFQSHREEIQTYIDRNVIPDFLTGLSFPRDAREGETVQAFIERVRREQEAA